MIKLKIEGMTCGHCVKTVQQTLARQPGVEDLPEVSLETGEALVGGTPQVEALVAALREEGYEAHVA